MSYTAMVVLAVLAVATLDLWVLSTRLLRRKVFWTSYAIILGFQLITNGVLAGRLVVRYDPAAVWQGDPETAAAPPFLGAGRIAYAPIEDLLFGFALVLLSQAIWVWWGRRGVQRTPYSGPVSGGWRTRARLGRDS